MDIRGNFYRVARLYQDLDSATPLRSQNGSQQQWFPMYAEWLNHLAIGVSSHQSRSGYASDQLRPSSSSCHTQKTRHLICNDLGVVYRIHCSNCPASYIGQTKRRLHQQIEEHKRAIRQADFNSSALAEHAWNHSHPVNWSNIKVLSNPWDTTTRLVEEAVVIRRTENTLNRDIGTLPTVW